MTEIKIEKNIPTPVRIVSFANKYPWKDMEIGDSFVVERVNGEPMPLTRDRANKAIQYARKSGRTYCTRAVENGVRVWRLS